MSKFTITRKIEFDAGHRVPYHNSKCYNIHGHRYVVEVVVEGELVEEKRYDKDMVMDFGDIKKIMMKVIHDKFDHSFIIWSEDDILEDIIMLAEKMNFKVRVITHIPTAERLAEYFFNLLKDEIDNNYRRLKKVIVWETPNSKAEYGGE